MNEDFLTERTRKERKRPPHCRTCVCEEDVKIISQVTLPVPKVRKMDEYCKRECQCGWSGPNRQNWAEDEWDQPAFCRPTHTTKIERKIHTDHKYGTLENWFKRFDFDCNGFLNLFELRAMLNFLGAHTHPDYIRRLMEKADRDGDGCLSFPEFLQMWRQAAVHDEDLYEIMKAHDLYPDVLQVEDFRGHYPRKEYLYR
ncbi:uncharacterized protein LOC129220740 [Uloborus diversus]|uniref:uncharacterized protein LOC129220740 n=1 Tax=Uloborus diversus TaxID=327109 RepID=UPI00240963C6|nr:uncharacterized protein LOC129220740 [Uloborus diversus]